LPKYTSYVFLFHHLSGSSEENQWKLCQDRRSRAGTRTRCHLNESERGFIAELTCRSSRSDEKSQSRRKNNNVIRQLDKTNLFRTLVVDPY
jgi:hypothetical protein